MATTTDVHIHAKDHTAQAFAAVKKNIDGVTHRLGHLKKELWALVGVAGFGALIERTIDTGAQIEKLSKQLGASTEALSQFKHVADVSHVSFEAVTRSWQILEKNVAAASQGLGPAKQAFQELGLSATALKKLRVEDQFSVLADAFTQVHNASQRGRLAMQIFSKAGGEMTSILVGGAQAIAAARLEADRLGLTLNETAAHQLAETHEAMIRLKSAFAGAANTLAIELGPMLSKVAAVLSQVLPQAVQGTVVGFIRLEAVVDLALSTVMAAFEKLYGVLGHLPGALGEPFREANQAAKAFREDLFATVSGYEKEIHRLQAMSQARGQAITQTAAQYAALYDPALQALAGYHRQASKLTAEQKADNQAWLKSLKEQEKQIQTHVEKVHSIFENGLFGFMEEGFKGMAASFKNTLMQMASQAAATELTQHVFGSQAALPQKGQGFFETLLGGSIGHALGGLFGGFRAGGGSVLAGKGYIVGERGPEWFMPRQHGQVFSNAQVSTASQSHPVSIVMHVHTPDAGSFRQASSQITAAMGVALQQAVKRNT